MLKKKLTRNLFRFKPIKIYNKRVYTNNKIFENTMKKIFLLIISVIILFVPLNGQTVDETNGNIVGFSRIVTGNDSWMDIQLAGSSSSFKIHDNTNGSNWVRWDAGSSYTEFLKNVKINSGTLELLAGANSTHATFSGSFSGPQGILIKRSGGASIRVLANYSSFGTGLESSSALRFSVNGNSLTNPSVFIKTNGNVGVGTTNPDELLTVKGKIHSEEVIVDLNVPGPDYVFEEDYKLPSLAELEAFIKTNKHLPEVPSAKEIEEEGIALGEMNMLLLKKIEEMTLYMIHAQKEIKSLKAANAVLIQKMEQLEESN